MNLLYVLSLLMVGIAIVAVYNDIPFVSQYTFWVVIAAYIILAGMKPGGK